MSQPSIAVVIPAFNEERWLASVVERVLSQSSPADEVLVVDDGSTDRTAEIAGQYVPDIRLVSLDENQGLAVAYNVGFEEAQSDYVAICPADDEWVKTKLEWQREILDDHPDVDVLFGAASFFGIETGRHPAPSRAGFQPPGAFEREQFALNRIPHPSSVVRRRFHLELGGYVPGTIAEDYAFWMLALRNEARFFYDPRVAVRMRIHGGNLSLRAERMFDAVYRIHLEHAPHVGDPELVDRVLALDLRRIGFLELATGHSDRASRALRESLNRRRSAVTLAALTACRLPGARGAAGHLLRAEFARRGADVSRSV